MVDSSGDLSPAVDLYPIYCNLSGVNVIFIGGGKVAYRKISSLLTSGALIHVIAPQVVPPLSEWVEEKRLTWDPRCYQAGDLSDARVVFAATNQPAVNQQVIAEAKQSGIWVNSVTDPGLGDFFVPARVLRGPLQLAVSTSGRSPVVARAIRAELEQLFGDEYIDYLEIMGAIRTQLQAKDLSENERLDILRSFAASDLLARLREQDKQQVMSEVEKQLKAFLD